MAEANLLSVIMLIVTYKPLMLSVVMLSIVLLSVIMLNVDMLSVVAPSIIYRSKVVGLLQSVTLTLV
jgi:hypothetical protein